MPQSDNNNFWNALLTAGASMYAQGKKKKEDNKQLEWMNSILADKRRYEEENVARYKSSPAAQMSPMIMEMLVGAYAPKFKKYGIDMPLDKMLAAITGGGSGPGGVSGAPEGTGGSTGATQRQSIDDLSSGKGIKWGFQARSDGTFGPANTTMKNGTQYTMGKLDPEIEGYNGKDWGNKLGSSDGDIFGREQTRDGTGGAEWTKDSKGRKVYGGTLATGGRTAYTPSKTNVSDWRDTIVHRGGMDDDNWVPEIEGTQSQDPISIMTGNGIVDRIQGSAVRNVPGAVGGLLFGPFGAAAGKRVGNAFYNSGFDGKKETPRDWGDIWSNLIFGRDSREAN